MSTIEMAMQSMADRIDVLANSLPDQVTIDNITDEYEHTINSIEALEEEWLIDEDLRELFSRLSHS